MKDRSSRGHVKLAREQRAVHCPIELRVAGDGSARLDGHPCVTETPYEMYDMFGPYTEIVRGGAFTKTLEEKADVRCLINHDGIPLARTKSGTLELEEDTTGLHSVVPQLDLNNPTVQELVSAMSRGNDEARDIDQMSFAFRVVRQVWSPDWMQRDILEVELFDVSVVTFPANPATSVGLRSIKLLEALEGLDGAGVDELLVGMRSSRHLPGRESIQVAQRALTRLLFKRDLDDDPGALALAVDAALDEVMEAIEAGEDPKDLVVAAAATGDALLEAMGLEDPDDSGEPAAQLSSRRPVLVRDRTPKPDVLSAARRARELELLKLPV